MNEIRFQNICKACDKLLVRPDSTISRIAIPWLHVIRPHPIFFKQYNRIFDQKYNYYHRLLFQKLLGCIRLCGAVFNKREYWIGRLPIETDIIIISHIINEKIDDKNQDFYYGDIGDKLSKQGYSVTIALINHTGISASDLIKKWSGATIPRVIFSSKLDIISEIKFLRDAAIESQKLKDLENYPGLDVPKNFLRIASVEALSGGVIWTLRLGLQIRKLVSKLNANSLIVTFEGHSWERVAFASAREASANIKCIGYQHATLFNGQHAIKRVLGKQYDPNIVLTSGMISKNQFDTSPMADVAKVIELGSNRFMQQGMVNKISDAFTCIVLPEGIESECKLLFEFSLRCAKILPKINFIWRLHPNMSLDKFLNANPELKKLSRNIYISKRPLIEDLQASNIALYRGSTAIVQAVALGVRPIYLSIEDEISINTLHDVYELHDSVSKVEDFIGLIHRFSCEDVNFQKLQDHCRNIYTPINTDNFILEIENFN